MSFKLEVEWSEVYIFLFNSSNCDVSIFGLKLLIESEVELMSINISDVFILVSLNSLLLDNSVDSLFWLDSVINCELYS